MQTILIAAGHGGPDPGAVGHGLREKDLTLATALACRDRLENNYTGHHIVMTRETDVRISLPAQRNLAAKVDADLLVEIHYNHNGPTATGFETFIWHGEVFEATKRNQRKIHNSAMDFIEPFGIPDRGMKTGNYYLPRYAPCSVVLVEGGFISNPREAAILGRPEFQQGLGYAIADGIAEALRLPAKKQPAPEEPWPPKVPIPKIIRIVGVKVDGQRRTDLVGFYADNGRTLLPMLDVGNVAGVKVEGKGDHIAITTGKAK